MHDFLSAMLFSTLLSISVGPIALIILRQSIVFGFRSALPAALGAAVADAVFAAVAFTGLKVVEAFWVDNHQLLTWGAIAYLLYLGVTTFKNAAGTMQITCTAGFVPVFLLTLTSPFTIAAISSYAIASGAQLQGQGIYWNLLGVLVGSFLGQMLYAAGGGGMKKLFAERSGFGVLNRASGVCLIGFAGWQMACALSL
ncbi:MULTISPECIES: LysE family translocator [Pseudomonas]|jgi:threonine/homoserine/homoserine lactone efflux protein|uniref:LysE family translocator n=5 Tax=Pseudomonas TaxID=286 RepID=UPI0008F0B8F0|nr:MULTISPECIES: LysE family transporter [Pseudomonas]PMV22829.1 hypothetical protein C1X17_14615 [Pseudomonas sp. FW305-3-2-15-C-TSA2]PMV29491.1 hypothetical protein C1X22_12185 [Pseudomonas sp. DP16D-L5]PMV39394.1 hypothetical protein C1X21_12300 [Pseudomonas sp. FW305-3-2-15-A-LB2]PMV45704.1 hypothetical protein C1X16_13830 [Pseudomonas sp. FW305-3-2-15-C-R2A1]PMV51853.1 hypothetical protein C1X18_11120 [Pseudomonas sp. FW305-3-2-15-C-LB1]